MTEARYAPGALRAVVTDAGAALIAAELSAVTLSRIWERMREGRGFPAVLEALTGAFGTSLTAIPSFAVVLFESGTARVAVRGDLSVQVSGASGVEVITGAGVTTWSERVVAAPGTIVLRGATGAAAELPVRDGVVFADAVEVDAAAAGPVPAASVPVASASGPVGPQPPAAEPAASPAPARTAKPAASPTLAPAAESEPAAPVAADAAVDVSATLMPIATVPEADLSRAEDAVPAAPSAESEPTEPVISAVPLSPARPAVDDTTGYDHLWGATVMRSVEDAAVRVGDPDDASAGDAPAVPAVAESADAVGDHDGRTISLAEARAQRLTTPAAGADDPVPPLAGPRPPAPGRIRLGSGQVVLLDRTVVVGRRPRSTRVVGTDLPHLIAVESPTQDISRSHVELRVEGDSIVATDLHTTNGTTLVRPGADPVRLHPGEPTVVVPGDVIDLGDGQTLQVEGLA